MIPTIDREALAKIYEVNQGYLGYLLREKKVPLPVRINGETLWYLDEVEKTLPKVLSFLSKRKKH